MQLTLSYAPLFHSEFHDEEPKVIVECKIRNFTRRFRNEFGVFRTLDDALAVLRHDIELFDMKDIEVTVYTDYQKVIVSRA